MKCNELLENLKNYVWDVHGLQFKGLISKKGNKLKVSVEDIQYLHPVNLRILNLKNVKKYLKDVKKQNPSRTD